MKDAKFLSKDFIHQKYTVSALHCCFTPVGLTLFYVGRISKYCYAQLISAAFASRSLNGASDGAVLLATRIHWGPNQENGKFR